MTASETAMMMPRVLLTVGLFLAMAGPAWAQHLSWDEVRVMPPLAAGERIAYGADSLQFGELRLPEGAGPHPVAILVHGGCWRSIADLHYVERLGRALLDAGWATWNLEFRRLDQPGGAWPGIFQDVAAGADHLRTLDGERPLDLARVVALGHSSGGHLALWLAARTKLPPTSELFRPDPIPLRGVVSLAGIGDPEHFQQLQSRACGDAAVQIVGGPGPRFEERMAEVSPARLLPLGVPQLVMSGEQDRAVPVAHARAYAARAEAAGDPVELIVVPDAAHFEVVAPWWLRWHEAFRPMLAFMERVTGEQGELGGRP